MLRLPSRIFRSRFRHRTWCRQIDCGDGDRGDARGQSDALSLVTLHRRLEPEATPASKLKLPHLDASNSRAMRAVDHIDPPRIGITSRCPRVVRLSLRCGISIRSISLVGHKRTSRLHLSTVGFTPERWGNRPASLWIAEK